MSNIGSMIYTVFSFFIKMYFLNFIKDFILGLIKKMETILKSSDNRVNEKILNIAFMFGIIYGKIYNYINALKLL